MAKYIYLRGVSQENRDLKDEIERLRLEQVRLSEDAQQARRLQDLLAFKEQFIAKTVAAQVIGSSGSSQSRTVYIDKGKNDGLDTGMAVITSDGVVGKIWQVYRVDFASSLDRRSMQWSGSDSETPGCREYCGGKPSGEVILEKIMADEQVQPGEKF